MTTKNKWVKAFLEDVEYDRQWAWTRNYPQFEDYLRAERSDQAHTPKYANLRRCLDTFGAKLIRHPRMTLELATALGAKGREKLLRKQQQGNACRFFAKKLLQMLDEDYVVPVEAARQFQNALVGLPFFEDK